MVGVEWDVTGAEGCQEKKRKKQALGTNEKGSCERK